MTFFSKHVDEFTERGQRPPGADHTQITPLCLPSRTRLQFSKAYEDPVIPFRFLCLPPEIRLLTYEIILVHTTVAVRRHDEYAPMTTHPTWALALANKQIRSELIRLIVDKDAFRFVHPMPDPSVWRPQHRDFDFIRAFLGHVCPDQQNKILGRLMLKLGYKLLRQNYDHDLIHPGFGCELALIHHNLSEVHFELPIFPLMSPNNGMIHNSNNIQALIAPPNGVPMFSSDMSEVQWPAQGEPGLDLTFPGAGYHVGARVLTVFRARNEVDFYHAQAWDVYKCDETTLTAFLNRSATSLWHYHFRQGLLEVGYVKTESGTVVWGARGTFLFKIHRSVPMPDHRQEYPTLPRRCQGAPSPSTANLPSTRTEITPENKRPENIDNIFWRRMQRLNDRTAHPTEFFDPDRRCLSEGYFPNAVERNGMFVVSRFNMQKGIIRKG